MPWWVASWACAIVSWNWAGTVLARPSSCRPTPVRAWPSSSCSSRASLRRSHSWAASARRPLRQPLVFEPVEHVIEGAREVGDLGHGLTRRCAVTPGWPGSTRRIRRGEALERAEDATQQQYVDRGHDHERRARARRARRSWRWGCTVAGETTSATVAASKRPVLMAMTRQNSVMAASITASAHPVHGSPRPHRAVG